MNNAAIERGGVFELKQALEVGGNGHREWQTEFGGDILGALTVFSFESNNYEDDDLEKNTDRIVSNNRFLFEKIAAADYDPTKNLLFSDIHKARKEAGLVAYYDRALFDKIEAIRAEVLQWPNLQGFTWEIYDRRFRDFENKVATLPKDLNPCILRQNLDPFYDELAKLPKGEEVPFLKYLIIFFDHLEKSDRFGLEQLVQAKRQKQGITQSGEGQDLFREPFDLLTLLDQEPQPVKWFVNDRLPAGRGALITGLGGSSKTRLLYHLAIGAALGAMPWPSWEMAGKGKSLLVLTEDVAEDVHRTLHGICVSLNLTREQRREVYESVITYPLAGSDLKLLRKAATTNSLEKSAEFYELEKRIKEAGNVLFVGLDPALSLTEGNEVDQGDQRALGKMADDLAVRTGAAVALVAHATKGSLTLDELQSHNSRGGGAITDAVRCEYVLRTMTAKEAGKAGITSKEERFTYVQLVATKGNNLSAAAYVPVWLRRDCRGNLCDCDIGERFQEGESKPTLTKSETIQIEALKQAITESGENPTPSIRTKQGIFSSKTVLETHWRKRAYGSGITSSTTQDGKRLAFYRIKQRLLDRGLIGQDGDRYWVIETWN
jgi:hypothetical protein